MIMTVEMEVAVVMLVKGMTFVTGTPMLEIENGVGSSSVTQERRSLITVLSGPSDNVSNTLQTYAKCHAN